MSLETVLSLAEAMRDARLWNGADREALSRLLARHTRHVGDALPPIVIHRWARFTPDQVRRACRVVLGEPSAQRPDLVPWYRTSINCTASLVTRVRHSAWSTWSSRCPRRTLALVGEEQVTA